MKWKAEKLVRWFGRKPVYFRKITENTVGMYRSRLFAIFIHGVESEVDMDYWKRDAEQHLADNIKYHNLYLHVR